MEQLAAKAKHFRTCVQKVEYHLAGLERGTDDRDRYKYSFLVFIQIYFQVVSVQFKFQLNLCS